MAFAIFATLFAVPAALGPLGTRLGPALAATALQRGTSSL